MDGRMRHSLGVLCVSSDCLPHDIVRNTEALSPVFFYFFSGFFGGVKLRRREKEKKVDFTTSLLCPPFPLPFVSCSITALSLHHFQMSASHLFFFFCRDPLWLLVSQNTCKARTSQNRFFTFPFSFYYNASLKRRERDRLSSFYLSADLYTKN